jgi:hypothetical protein
VNRLHIDDHSIYCIGDVYTLSPGDYARFYRATRNSSKRLLMSLGLAATFSLLLSSQICGCMRIAFEKFAQIAKTMVVLALLEIIMLRISGCLCSGADNIQHEPACV